MRSIVESILADHYQLANFLPNLTEVDSLGNAYPAENLNSLYVPFLGQSNGQYMSKVFDPYQPGAVANDDSGAIILERELSNLLGTEVFTSDTWETNFAVGGSKVNGNGDYQDDSTVWWYPEEERPGGALKRAEQELDDWFTELGAQPTDEVAIIWSQGESDIGDVSSGTSEAREQYKESTVAVFDYLRDRLDFAEIKFYLVPTGRLQETGAANRGFAEKTIATMQRGVDILRELQSEIALERDDVQLAPDYADLNMVYEEGLVYGDSYDFDYQKWSTDFLHLGHDGLKVNGDRLAQYIAVDRGASNVISFTDSFGDPADSISLTRDGLLDLNISANPSSGLIQGTDLPDVIVGTLAADEITGGAGNDVIIASQERDLLTGGAGNDVFFYDPLVYPDTASHADRLVDFTIGSDRLDVSELLKLSNYAGSDPIADGYVMVVPLNETSIEVRFDPDGAGVQPAASLATLDNIDPVRFKAEFADQIIITPTEF